MRKSRFTAEQMLAAVKMADAGTPVADVCRELGLVIRLIMGGRREECFEMNSFRTLEEARLIIADWRRDYNSLRPHSSLRDKTPNQVWKELSEHHDGRSLKEVAK